MGNCMKPKSRRPRVALHSEPTSKISSPFDPPSIRQLETQTNVSILKQEIEANVISSPKRKSKSKSKHKPKPKPKPKPKSKVKASVELNIDLTPNIIDTEIFLEDNTFFLFSMENLSHELPDFSENSRSIHKEGLTMLSGSVKNLVTSPDQNYLYLNGGFTSVHLDPVPVVVLRVSNMELMGTLGSADHSIGSLQFVPEHKLLLGVQHESDMIKRGTVLFEAGQLQYRKMLTSRLVLSSLLRWRYSVTWNRLNDQIFHETLVRLDFNFKAFECFVRGGLAYMFGVYKFGYVDILEDNGAKRVFDRYVTTGVPNPLASLGKSFVSYHYSKRKLQQYLLFERLLYVSKDGGIVEFKTRQRGCMAEVRDFISVRGLNICLVRKRGVNDIEIFSSWSHRTISLFRVEGDFSDYKNLVSDISLTRQQKLVTISLQNHSLLVLGFRKRKLCVLKTMELGIPMSLVWDLKFVSGRQFAGVCDGLVMLGKCQTLEKT